MTDISYNAPTIKVSIDDVEYTVPERTERLEKQLKAHDEKIKSVSQYQSDYDLVKIILGNDAVKKIFPKGEDENLDRMHFIVTKLMEVYYQNYQQLEKQSYEEQLDQIGRMNDKVGNLVALQKLRK